MIQKTEDYKEIIAVLFPIIAVSMALVFYLISTQKDSIREKRKKTIVWKKVWIWG